MKLEDQVCSLDLAKRLKELGVKQEGYFYWVRRSEAMPSAIVTTNELRANEDDAKKGIDHPFQDVIAAFTVAELWALLLPHAASLSLSKDEVSGHKVQILPHIGDWAREYDTSPANALSKILAYLIENKLITA